MIKVSINGKVVEVTKGISVQDLVDQLGYKNKGFAVAIDTIFIAIDSYSTTILQDGNTIDILGPVQGG